MVYFVKKIVVIHCARSAYMDCVRVHGPYMAVYTAVHTGRTRLCICSWTRAVYTTTYTARRVHGTHTAVYTGRHGPYAAVYTACSRPCTGPIHGRVHVSCTRPCTHHVHGRRRPCTRPVYSRVHGRCTRAVCTAGTRPCTRSCNGSTYGEYIYCRYDSHRRLGQLMTRAPYSGRQQQLVLFLQCWSFFYSLWCGAE